MVLEEKGAESNRPLSTTTMASANTYLINIWPEDTLSVPKTPFSHYNEEAIKEKNNNFHKDTQEWNSAVREYISVTYFVIWFV